MNFRQSLAFFLFIAATFVSSSAAFAQNTKYAEEAYETGNYFEAVDQYLRLLDKDPDNIEYKMYLGLSYLKTNTDPKKALGYLLKVVDAGDYPDYILVELAKAHMFHLDYDEAKRNLLKFERRGGVTKKTEDDFSRMIANCDAALDLIKYPVDVTFENLGDEINSEYPDYHPFITRDGKTILYTSRRKIRPGSKPEFDGYYPSDIFMAKFENGEWSRGNKMGDRINTIYDEQSVGLSQTGDSMFFYIDHVEEFGDIYVSTRKGATYANPVKLNEEINSSAVESACSVSKDGSTIIFSSNRPGGYGGLDIWMIRRLNGGGWGKAVNLGPEINTRFNEDFPTLSSDGITLYYTSDGHPGMGGYDLYFSTWDGQNTVWTKPQNLGYPINGPANDKTISFSGKGNKAVMTGRHDDTIGDLDIYSIKYNNEIEDGPAVFLINIPTNESHAAAQIEIKNEFDELIGQYLPNRITGRYLIALPTGKYFIYVDTPGFKPYNEVLIVSDFHKRQLHNVKLIKLEQ